MFSDIHPQAICFCADVIYSVASKAPLWIEVSQYVHRGPSEKKKKSPVWIEVFCCGFIQQTAKHSTAVPSFAHTGMGEKIRKKVNSWAVIKTGRGRENNKEGKGTCNTSDAQCNCSLPADLGPAYPWGPGSHIPANSPSFIVQLEVIWFRIFLWPAGVSCPGCVHSQLLVLPQLCFLAGQEKLKNPWLSVSPAH